LGGDREAAAATSRTPRRLGHSMELLIVKALVNSRGLRIKLRKFVTPV
jgi:hypothetical protein